MKFGSLFSGYGGIDLGLERAGMECRWQVEIDEDCRQVLRKQFPGVKQYGDITKVKGSELEPVDVLAGGFPCQDLSQAGKRKGFEHPDGTRTRSGLWWEFARLISEIRPRYVLAENVPGLLTQPGAMGAVVGELARLGYVGSWRCLRASDFGASHLRKRVFIVGYLANPLRTGPSPQQDKQSHIASLSYNSAFSPSTRWPQTGQRLDIDTREGSEAGSGVMGDAASARLIGGISGESGEVWNETRRRESGGRCDTVADAGKGQFSEPRRGSQGRDGIGSAGAILANGPGIGGTSGFSAPTRGDEEPTESAEPFDSCGRDVPDATISKFPNSEHHRQPHGAVTEFCGAFRGDGQFDGCGENLGDTQCGLMADSPIRGRRELRQSSAPGPNDPRWPSILRERPDLAPALAGRLNSRFVEFLMGFPIGFTEINGADAKEARSRIVLRGLQQAIISQANQRNTGGRSNIQKAQILRSEVYGARPEKSTADTICPLEADRISEEGLLRTVRDKGEASYSPPQGQELEERRSSEHSDIVQQLSHLVASCERRNSAEGYRAALQILQSPDATQVCLQYLSDTDKAGWVRSSRKHQAQALVEAATAARPMSRRTKRLSRLGNAVIPDCAEFMGLCIVEFEKQMECA